MDLPLRQILLALLCAVVAVCAGWQIAQGGLFSFTIGGVITATAVLLSLGAIFVRLFQLPFDVIFLGWLLFGYIVGNRGFAQLTPSPNLPLLPAEVGLLLVGGWCLVSAGFARRLPFRYDLLNWLVLGWLVAGFARLLFDLPRFGFVALRDSATVYYALFFFLAQDLGRNRSSVRYLLACCVAGCLALAPVAILYRAFPEVFLRHLTVHGVPVIFQKGDLIYTFFALGSLFVYFGPPVRWRWVTVPLSCGMFLYVVAGENRASLVGLSLATVALLVTRRWRFPAVQYGAALLGLLILLGIAVVGNNTWAERRLDGLRDRLLSLTDLRGLRAYQSEDSSFKGDNNRFRLVWWRNIVEDTWAENPTFGRGFGADLAGGFLQEYYPEGGEEFSARSPHNIFLTVFGRMGGVGLAVWLGLVLQLARRGWNCLRRQEDPIGWALWCSLAVMLVSATFGVVLEGPMGAVPFWILAGVANARWHDYAETAAAPAPVAAPPAPEPSLVQAQP